MKFLHSASSTLNGLLYNFLEEILYMFSCDAYLAIKRIDLSQKIVKDDEGLYFMAGSCFGEEYSRPKHFSRTEVKSVTFSNMRIVTDSPDNLFHIYVIFDI